MKKHYIVALLAIALTLPFACKKKDNTEPEDNSSSTTTTGGTTGGGSTGGGALTFSEGGASITVDSVNAVLYKLGVAPFNREIDVYAYKAGNQVLEMHFLPTTGSQTVSTNFNGAWLTFKTNNGMNYPNDYYNCTSGSFNLTTCDTINNSIVGTFSFIGNNGNTSKTISNGTLNITKIKKQ